VVRRGNQGILKKRLMVKVQVLMRRRKVDRISYLVDRLLNISGGLGDTAIALRNYSITNGRIQVEYDVSR
jgi:hypothetical protein